MITAPHYDAPHETPIPGPAAQFADRMAALIPVVTTQRLRLRAPRLTDFPVWADIVCSDRGQYMMGPMTRDEAWNDFARLTVTWLLRGHGGWIIDEVASRRSLGVVLIGFEPGDREPELGFALKQEHEGKGFASEAARAARDYARSVMRLPSLVSYVAPGNHRSIKLLRGLGASPDGIIAGAECWRHFTQERVQ